MHLNQYKLIPDKLINWLIDLKLHFWELVLELIYFFQELIAKYASFHSTVYDNTTKIDKKAI